MVDESGPHRSAYGGTQRHTTAPAASPKGPAAMADELSDLRAQASNGDQGAIDQLVELAGERGDFDELRRLADAGSRDAADVLVELAEDRAEDR